MACSICGDMSHNRTFHKGPMRMKKGGKKNKVIDKLSTEIARMVRGGIAKKGLLADLLKGIDLRIQAL